MKEIMQTKTAGLQKNLTLLGVAALVIVLDQISKAYVKAHLALNSSWMPLEWLAPMMRFTHIKNTGAAFGFFQNANLVLGILAVIIVGVLIVFYQKVHIEEKLARVALGMQVGGAIGNLIDRVLDGHVTDFISVGSFPIFNIADSAVTVGVGLLLLAIYLQERKQKHLDGVETEAANQPEDSSENRHDG